MRRIVSSLHWRSAQDAGGMTPDMQPAPETFLLIRVDTEEESAVRGGELCWQASGDPEQVALAKITRAQLANLIAQGVQQLAYQPSRQPKAIER